MKFQLPKDPVQFANLGVFVGVVSAGVVLCFTGRAEVGLGMLSLAALHLAPSPVLRTGSKDE